MTTPSSPWHASRISYGGKLGITTAFLLLICLAVSLVFIAFGTIYELFNPSELSSTSTSLIAIGVSLVLLAACCLGIYKLFPSTRKLTDFKPSYGSIAPDAEGQPFEVRFQRADGGRNIMGKGKVQFTPGGLLVEGWLTPSALLQIGIVLLVTIIPMVICGMALGIIPALLIAYYVGRKNLSLTLPYSSLLDLKLHDGSLKFRLATPPPKKVSFYVALADAERLYREVERHPAVPGASPFF
ncbi:hypothetical protein F8S13_21215 [Chloroflexia bacterium SDU3-3]|nr:hypothetical protein F8S13_21215 [Chloroflexia bacterium SDU3-3]